MSVGRSAGLISALAVATVFGKNYNILKRGGRTIGSTVSRAEEFVA